MRQSIFRLLTVLSLVCCFSSVYAQESNNNNSSSNNNNKTRKSLRRGQRQLNSIGDFHCGCTTCDDSVWNSPADDHSCGERVEWLQATLGATETEACIRIGATEFPVECGACNPISCPHVQSNPPLPSPQNCNCQECTSIPLNTFAGDHTCGDRINWLQSTEGLSEEDACVRVAGVEHPGECRGCNPETCDQGLIPPPTVSPSEQPTGTKSVPASPTAIPTERPTLKPSEQPTPSPSEGPTSSGPFECGCRSCTEGVWNADADGYTCGQRISWLEQEMNLSKQAACAEVGAREFPMKCGACNPTACDGNDDGGDDGNENGGNDDGGDDGNDGGDDGNENGGNDDGGDDGNDGGDENQGSGIRECGGAVNTSGSSQAMCQDSLWGPTGDSAMHCFAYGGAGDPCHLNNNNDINDGLDKDPSLCSGDTFYLWDEPDTQGKCYSWAGLAWKDYVTEFEDEIIAMRQAGTKVTSPLITAGSPDVIYNHVETFFDSCGPPCTDPNSPMYIDIIAVNAFCGPWNGPPLFCRGGADYIVDEVKKVTAKYNLPVYITNWSRLQTSNTDDQVEAIDAIDSFFNNGSPIERVYWFGATDYGGGSANNRLADVTASGETLGQLWKQKCDSL